MSQRRIYSTEKELITAIREDDNDAFAQLYKDNKRAITNYFYKKFSVFDEDEIDYFYTDSCFTTYENIKKANYKEGNLAGYLRTVCFNKLNDELRKKNRLGGTVSFEENLPIQGNDDEGDSYYIPELSINLWEDEEQLENEIQSLESAMNNDIGLRCKELLKQIYWENLSLKDIAKQSGKGENSEKNQAYRCRESLRKILIQKYNFKIVQNKN